jgi:hypothetical protein
VLIGSERNDITVLSTIGVIRKHAESKEVRRGEKQVRIGVSQSRFRLYLLPNGSELPIGDSSEVQRDLGAHGINSESV